MNEKLTETVKQLTSEADVFFFFFFVSFVYNYQVQSDKRAAELSCIVEESAK